MGMHARHTATFSPFQKAITLLRPGFSLGRAQCLQHRKREKDFPCRQSSTQLACAAQTIPLWQKSAPYETITLGPADDAAELEATCQFLARHLESWLNEEWTVLDTHHDLALEAVKAYRDVRLQGEDELGSVLLGVSMSLLEFNFRDTFVDAYEVSNKVAELLMLHEDREVCCRSEADEERHERIERERNL